MDNTIKSLLEEKQVKETLYKNKKKNQELKCKIRKLMQIKNEFKVEINQLCQQENSIIKLIKKLNKE